jgi:uncharacterized protein YbjQ (UPF0145 family)
MVNVQCRACLAVSDQRNPSATGWDCGPCGGSYVLRRCSACGIVSDVSAFQRQGEPWDCVWCQAPNSGFSYRITQVHGDVFGLTVRSRSYFSNLGAQLTSVVGGEVPGYTKLLTDSRNQARERMWGEARTRGANAVVAMRFDCNELSGVMSEIAAYGTAVTVERCKGPGD